MPPLPIADAWHGATSTELSFAEENFSLEAQLYRIAEIKSLAAAIHCRPKCAESLQIGDKGRFATGTTTSDPFRYQRH